MPEKDKITEAIADRDLINKAFRESYYEVLKLHKQAGLPVVVMRDGKITWIKAEELLGDYLVKIAWLR